MSVTEAANHVLHSFKKIRLTSEFWSEGAGVGDLNRDGHMDVVSGPYWYAGPDFEHRLEFYSAKKSYVRKTVNTTEQLIAGWDPKVYSDNFFAFTHDFNKDDWPDILILGFPGKEAAWFQNPQGVDRHWQRHVVFDSVDNESPHWTDLTGDGRPEIVCNHDGYFGYISPNWENPATQWTFHPISPKGQWTKFTHGLGIGDVNGDSRLDILEKDGWWEQPTLLESGVSWKLHPYDFGSGGAQMHVYDVNGDGRNDVVTSLVAHGFGLAWFEQVKENDGISFRQHIIMNREPHENRFGLNFSMIHAVDLKDMDGDGLKDIVAGKRYWLPGYRRETEPGSPSPIYWFKLVRDGLGAHFVPYLIEPTAGVGVHLTVGEINGDHNPDVVMANKQGTFVFLHETKTVSASEWREAQPKVIKRTEPR